MTRPWTALADDPLRSSCRSIVQLVQASREQQLRYQSHDFYTQLLPRLSNPMMNWARSPQTLQLMPPAKTYLPRGTILRWSSCLVPSASMPSVSAATTILSSPTFATTLVARAKVAMQTTNTNCSAAFIGRYSNGLLMQLEAITLRMPARVPRRRNHRK